MMEYEVEAELTYEFIRNGAGDMPFILLLPPV